MVIGYSNDNSAPSARNRYVRLGYASYCQQKHLFRLEASKLKKSFGRCGGVAESVGREACGCKVT
jgi:hypothetical protein